MVGRVARDQEWDRLGARAVQVWGECAACGWVLGAAGAFILAVAAVAAAGTATLAVGGAYSVLVAAFGGMCGLVIGMVVGIPFGLLVRFGEGRLGARGVGRLMPVVALIITAPPAVAFGRLAGTEWAIAALALDTTFTLVGARWIARRYVGRAEVARVH